MMFVVYSSMFRVSAIYRRFKRIFSLDEARSEQKCVRILYFSHLNHLTGESLLKRYRSAKNVDGLLTRCRRQSKVLCMYYTFIYNTQSKFSMRMCFWDGSSATQKCGRFSSCASVSHKCSLWFACFIPIGWVCVRCSKVSLSLLLPPLFVAIL